MSATGLLETSLPQLLDYQLCAAVDCRHKAFILIDVAWPCPVIAIVGEWPSANDQAESVPEGWKLPIRTRGK
jgi:hypothetical protein